MRALLLLVLCACSGGGDTASEDTDRPEDSGGDTTAEKVDTGMALVYVEGTAALDETAWIGEESYVATSRDGAVEHCRVTNPTTGTPAAELCPGCTFGFDVVFGAGTAAGEACANVKLEGDEVDGDTWTYAFADTYVTSAYTYEDVLLFGYSYGGAMVWTPWAFAAVDTDETVVDYESMYAYTSYYYYL